MALAAGGDVGTAVLGAGPAGLTAAYVLAEHGVEGVVFEADGVVGGIAKTVEFNGYRFDLGGHRFFTKLPSIQRLWEEMLGEEFLVRPRLSRIYYQGKYLAYPLRARDIPTRLGLIESTLCAFSYFASQLRSRHAPESFEDWVTLRFGRRLYETFFRTYTEKVWGIPGSEIRSEWAAQRIREFSLLRAATYALRLRRNAPPTLIEKFHYPRLGPGQMWEAFRDRVEEGGIPVHCNRRCTGIRHAGWEVESVIVRTNGHETEFGVDGLLSSIPLGDLVLSLEPAAPPEVQAAARKLRYRHLCLVALITTEAEPFADNWIYLHDPGVLAGRVQNFGAWSQGMVRPGTTCLGVEYFCFEGDAIWRMSDEEAVALATRELATIGLIDPTRVVDGVKVRVPRAYPVYDREYREAVDVLRNYIGQFENLETFGRNGLHRYNNQDHSMWTAILAAANLLDGGKRDAWAVNTDAVYLEQGELVDSLLKLGLDPVN
ncbi:MAG: NAD(P)/FAD-dependent oxidoreductase [Gaiellaceae bacterium]